MTPFTVGFCFALSSMSVTARFLAFLFVYPMKSICRRARSWRSPTSRLYTTADAIFLCDISRNTIKSRFRKLLIRRYSGHSASSSPSIDRSNFPPQVSTSLHTNCRRARQLLSDSENIHFRSTAFLNSLLTLSSRRPFLPVLFSFVVERDLRPGRNFALN
jgi:hypothetical protein